MMMSFDDIFQMEMTELLEQYRRIYVLGYQFEDP